jgi:hypothetical protein
MEPKQDHGYQAGAENSASLGNHVLVYNECRWRGRPIFDLAIERKLRGCDIVKMKIGDLIPGGRVRSRANVI